MSEDLSPELIYQYDNHTNIPWNMVEYSPMRQYLGNPVNSNRATRYETKKGCYMDEHVKIVKDLPSPDKYTSVTLFDQSQNKKYSHKIKINPRLKKQSYLDDIERMGKKTKYGVGSYNLEKTQKQIEDQLNQMAKYTKTSHAQRPSFYQDIQTQSNLVPGAGNYNPHLDVLHLKKQRMTPENWRQKHQKQSKEFIKKKRKEPGPSSYRPASAGTFDRMKIDLDKKLKRKQKSLNKSFGTDAKFIYCRPNKKKIVEQRPDPTIYDLHIKWKGKKDETKSRGWKSFVSTRSNSFSIYNG